MASKIKFIKFKKDETFIGFDSSDHPRDMNSIVTDKDMKRSDLPRHADFQRSLDRLKPHLLIALELQKPTDVNGNFLQKMHFDNFFSDSEEEAERFGGLDMVGIQIKGKHAADGVILIGTKTTSYGAVVKLVTPPLELKRSPEGYNYPLLEVLDVQIDQLLHEAEQYLSRKKHGAGVQQEIPLKNPDVNTTAKAKKEQEKLALAEV